MRMKLSPGVVGYEIVEEFYDPVERLGSVTTWPAIECRSTLGGKLAPTAR